MGQLWSTNSDGGYLYSDNLSKILRNAVQPLTKFRQFADAKDATTLGLHAGQSYHWNIFSDVATQGGTLIETATMPETNFVVSQGTLSITEYGNSVPFTEKLDDLSEQPVTEVIKKALKNDAKKAFDIGAYNQFDATLLRAVGTATDGFVLTSNGTATLTNSMPLGKELIKAFVDGLKERNVPPYMADDYMGLAHPTTWRPLKNDLETIHTYVGSDKGLDHIMWGEIGRYESTRFVEQNNIPKGGAEDSTTFDPATKTADLWDNLLSSWAFIFGDDTVAEAIAIPEELRGKLPSDFGRSRAIAWYYLGGFGIVHGADAVQSRIIKWDTAS